MHGLEKMNESEKQDLFQDVVDNLNDAGFDAEYWLDYSGRAMNGQMTAAIVTNAPAALIGVYLAGRAVDLMEMDNESCEALKAFEMAVLIASNLRTDSMGRDQSVYY